MRILEKIEIVNGEPGPTINLGVSGVNSLIGYSCKMCVLNTHGKEIVAKRDVTQVSIEEGKELFTITLSALDTEMLSGDLFYIWKIEITNDMVYYNDETRIGIVVSKKNDI
ncbi:MAG: hypothetical protein AAF462_08200 [Thermodesulfobacteriota bacterium]